LVINCCW